MEKVATDIYTFSQLRNEGFTYVDKTDALFAMASGEIGKQFFIARPRRFGKSLAISSGRIPASPPASRPRLARPSARTTCLHS